jgi:glycosylphosphatidylinositol transamidase (GPIT) subunit GPI8
MQDERLRDIIPDTIKTVFFCKVSDVSVYLIKKLWNLNRYSLKKAGVELNGVVLEAFIVSKKTGKG